MSVVDHLKDTGFRVVPRLHRTILEATGGRALGSFSGMPVVELHTTGRRSGRRRTTMLTAPVIDGDRVVLVASKGGDDRHPEWFLNLSANPEVALRIHGRTRQVRARVANADEKAELWPRIIAAYRGYGSYQRRTRRDIPVIICEDR